VFVFTGRLYPITAAMMEERELPSEDEARRNAANIAKLPELSGKS
jgi:hypothetical protein